MKIADLIAGLAGLHAAPFAPLLAAAAAIPVVYVMHVVGGFPLVAIATLIGAVKVWWAAPRAETPVVSDAFIGQMIAFWGLSGGLWATGAPPTVFPLPGLIGGFVMFNLFVRLPPLRRLGEKVAIWDDLAAGVMASGVVVASALIAHGAV